MAGAQLTRRSSLRCPSPINVRTAKPLDAPSDVIVLGVWAQAAREEGKSEARGSLSTRSIEPLGGGLAAHRRERRVHGQERSDALPADARRRIAADRIVLIGLGDAKAASADADARSFAAKAARTANGEKAKTLALALPDGLESAPPRARRRARARRVPLHEVPHRRSQAESAARDGRRSSSTGEVRRAGQEAISTLGQQHRRRREPLARSLERAAERPHPGRARDRRAGAAEGARLQVRRASTSRRSRSRGMQLLHAVGQGSVARAALRPHVVRASKEGEEEARLRRQGHHVRHRRHLHQARRRHGRDEARHGRRRERGRPHGGVAALKPEVEVHAIIAARREHARRQRLPPRRRLGLARRQDRSRSSTPTPRGAWSSPTRSRTRESSSPTSSSTTPRSPAPASSRSATRAPASTRRTTRPRDAVRRRPSKPRASRCGACRSSRS